MRNDRSTNRRGDRFRLSYVTGWSCPSVQNTLYRIGRAEVEKVRLSLPNKHHILFDLSRFGMENNNEIFHATNEPYGLIEGTVERKG